jgi:ABC-type maltose transport system permease subunit
MGSDVFLRKIQYYLLITNVGKVEIIYIYIVTSQSIATQRLDKHHAISPRNNRMNAYSLLLSNSKRANALAG